MSPIYLKRRIPYSILLFFILCLQANTQEYSFKKTGQGQGICHPFVYTINQDQNGYLWVGSGEGICRFDGINFTTTFFGDTLVKDVVTSSFEDSDKNLWFGFQNGFICKYNGKRFIRINSPTPFRSSVVGFAEPEKGVVLAASMNEGIMAIAEDNEVYRHDKPFKAGNVFTLYGYEDLLLVGTQQGLTAYTISGAKSPADLLHQIDQLSYIRISDIKPVRDSKAFWIATAEEGVYKLTINDEKAYQLDQVKGLENIQDKNIQSLFQDSENNLWISTLRNGVFKIAANTLLTPKPFITHYHKDNGLHTDFAKLVMEDREYNIWIATYGEGLAMLRNEAFSFYSLPQHQVNNNIMSICAQDSFLWIGGENGLLRALAVNPSDNRFHKPVINLPKDEITALYFDGVRTLWVGTAKMGIFKVDVHSFTASVYSYTSTLPGRTVNAITGSKGKVYVATKGGIFYFDTKTGKTTHYSTNTGLPHNDIKHVIIDTEGRLLYATRANSIEMISHSGDMETVFAAGDFEIEFNSLVQDANGKIWASTYGSGVFCFSPDSFILINTYSGLKSDYCYSIGATNNNYIWVGHRLGISRIEVNSLSIELFDIEQGFVGDCNPNAIYKPSHEVLYIGTTQGLVSYKPHRDKQLNVAPATNISRVLINDVSYDFTSQIYLPYSKYKVKIEFSGIYLSNPEGVFYQYILEGYDQDWSEITPINSATYPRVLDGKYTFRLRVYNKQGLVSEVPATFQLRIKLPVYKTWWFMMLSIVILVIGVWLIIKIRERKQKHMQEYLERSLAERTREVVEQKEEIEVKNRDITDSINYAQRIQASILPPLKRLQYSFAGAFVYYQPRDIVSGDFYWYDKISDNKFVIVCADSTGHGVPGAFMSLIGTTLIKDICSREETQSPSDILRSLDIELRNTLNQNLEAERSNDGMDIIVCEIDLRTHYLRYASAMRPMIIFKDNEELYIKGSRSSVGGHYDVENKSEKIFQDEGIQLSKGDLIYMFSDGYPDQFGGPMGKKYKMVRLRNLLADIIQKPMDEQYNYVKSTFNLWREGYPQVDDVLFMGIRL